MTDYDIPVNSAIKYLSSGLVVRVLDCHKFNSAWSLFETTAFYTVLISLVHTSVFCKINREYWHYEISAIRIICYSALFLFISTSLALCF